MEPFTKVRGPMAPLHRHDVDTDQIIPKQFLKRIERTGFGEFVFYDWRDEDGYVLHDEEFRDAPVLVTGRNFGCGSSREHAPWALADHGYRAIIAPSFADIFHTNYTKNGLLPVVLQEEIVLELIEMAHGEPGAEIEVDLHRQVVVGPDGREHPFEVEGHVRERLLNGWDDVSITLRHESAIDEFERERERPGTATLAFAEPPSQS